jgi:cell division septum initiation protein DivIVA
MHVFDRRDETTELAPVFDPVGPRFPIARQGYDCATVDEYVADIERELGELDGELAALRATTPSNSEAAAEIQRLGKQTSGILLAAHDGAQEITRMAQEQADRCLADAASNALAITSDANQQVSDLQNEIASLCGERDRILKDVRKAANSLKKLAGDVPDVLPSEEAARPG